MVYPKVSLILTTLNSLNNFTKTYSSIKEQNYPNIEIIVVDGGSTDGTLEAIQESAAKEHGKLIWVSEKDNGIYCAMNKGLKLASGEFIVFFNDVFYHEYLLFKLVEAVEIDRNYIGAHGDLVYCQNKKVKRYWKMGDGCIKDGWMPAHPTLLLRKKIYDLYGDYKEDYKCSADYEFMVRILHDGTNKLAYVPEILVSMFYGGTSNNSIKAYLVSFTEAIRALKENNVTRPYWVSLKRAVKVMKQYL